MIHIKNASYDYASYHAPMCGAPLQGGDYVVTLATAHDIVEQDRNGEGFPLRFKTHDICPNCNARFAQRYINERA
jgi:hypothetical protein